MKIKKWTIASLIISWSLHIIFKNQNLSRERYTVSKIYFGVGFSNCSFQGML